MRSVFDRPIVLVGLALVCAVAAFHLCYALESPRLPPDEAALSLNAYTLSSDLRDEDGALLPLFFRSFDDYKSPLYPYVLAGSSRSPGLDARRQGLSAVLVLAAVLLLGLLARRLTQSGLVAAVVLLAAGLTPWLFELGRIAIEATTEPILVVLLLLRLERTRRLELYDVRHGVGVGALVGAIAYSYTGSRLLGPLLAAALVVFGGRALAVRHLRLDYLPRPARPDGRVRARHPGTPPRYEATTIARDGLSRPRVVLQAIGNWFRDVDPWHWATAGDPAPYIHNGGYGAMFAAVVALAIAGAVIVLVRRRRTSGGATCSWRPFSCRFPRR